MLIKILIVEDEPQVLTSLGKTFTTTLKGYLILTAMSANEGLSILKEHKPDIAIVDVRLGPASGMDLIADYYAWIEKQGEGYRPTFIVITAYDDEAVKKRAEEFKVDYFLMKPFSKETILHIVIDAICKILHNELTVLDGLRNHYKEISKKVDDIGKKLGG